MMTVLVSDTPGTFLNASIAKLISVMFGDDIITAKAREEFVKNNLVNYSEEARNVTTPNTDDDSLESFLLNRKRR